MFFIEDVTSLLKNNPKNPNTCLPPCKMLSQLWWDFGCLDLNLRKNITNMLFIRGVLASYILSLSSCFSHLLFTFCTLAALTQSGGIIFLTVSQTHSQL